MTIALSVLGILGLLYATVIILVCWVSIRPPRTPIFTSPGAMGAPQESVNFPGREALPLAGWWVEGPAHSPVVILTHGYLMSRAEPSSVARQLWAMGCTCLLFDFPAHGKSPGKRCTVGWQERLDILCAIDYVRSRKPDAPIVLWGSSMGAAAAVFAVAERPDGVHAMILDSVYSRLIDACDGWWNFLGLRKIRLIMLPVRWLSSWFLRMDLRSIDVGVALSTIRDVPTLLLHGDVDTLSTPSQAIRNQKMAQSQCELVWFEGCTHSEARWECPSRYEEVIAEFLTQNKILTPENKNIRSGIAVSSS